MKPVLLVDGVTGAGKTSVLAELRKNLGGDVTFIPEEETLGDLMTLFGASNRHLKCSSRFYFVSSRNWKPIPGVTF